MLTHRVNSVINRRHLIARGTAARRASAGKLAVKSEERLIPIIRAALAEKMAAEGFHVKEIAATLNVTQAAVTQYLKKKRGGGRDGLAEHRAPHRPARREGRQADRGQGWVRIETVELLETARQVMVMNAGKEHRREQVGGARKERVARAAQGAGCSWSSSAAEKYLELANKTTDDHTKLLLRMIASDSIRHGDVVSQVISWLEAESKRKVELPGKELLESMLAMEDSAKEASLRESVKVDHPVARLLLEWIDMDEAKHGKMVVKMLALGKNRGGAA